MQDKDDQLARFIGDAIEFVKGQFVTGPIPMKPAISESAAHIYISALPFAPSSSLVTQHYLPLYPHSLSVKDAAWNPDEIRSGVGSAALSRNGERIVASRRNRTLQVLDTKTGSVVFSSPFRGITGVAISPDGILIATSSGQLWNAETGKEQKLSFVLQEGRAVAFSPDSSHLAIGGSELHVWNLSSGEISSSPFKGHEGYIGHLTYSSDGTQIISGEGRFVHIWDSLTGTIISTIELPPSRPNVYFSSDGTYITVQIDSISSYSPDGTEIDIQIRSISYSPDGTQIAVSDSGGVHLWRLSPGTFHTLDDDPAESLAFSPNGKFLVSGLTDAIQIWDLLTYQSIAKLVGHSDSIMCVAFFPDGKQIMSASSDTTIRIWHIESLLEGKSGEMDEWGAAKTVRYGLANWILDSKGGHLFHAGRPFRHPRNTLVIGECSEIDFSHFVHGTDWVRCREPLEDGETKENAKAAEDA